MVLIRMARQITTTNQQLIEGLRDSDPSAVEEFISMYRERARAFLRRRKVAENDMGLLIGDMVGTMMNLARSNALRNPDGLPGFFWAVARKRVALYRAYAACNPGPEFVAIGEAVLACLPERERDALIHYYLGEQTPEQICHVFELTVEEWRGTKSRARAMFGAGHDFITRHESC